MNKQNKKIAQEKRRIEREKAEKKAKVVNLLKFWDIVRHNVDLTNTIHRTPNQQPGIDLIFRKNHVFCLDRKSVV